MRTGLENASTVSSDIARVFVRPYDLTRQDLRSRPPRRNLPSIAPKYTLILVALCWATILWQCVRVVQAWRDYRSGLVAQEHARVEADIVSARVRRSEGEIEEAKDAQKFMLDLEGKLGNVQSLAPILVAIMQTPGAKLMSLAIAAAPGSIESGEWLVNLQLRNDDRLSAYQVREDYVRALQSHGLNVVSRTDQRALGADDAEVDFAASVRLAAKGNFARKTNP